MTLERTRRLRDIWVANREFGWKTLKSGARSVIALDVHADDPPAVRFDTPDPAVLEPLKTVEFRLRENSPEPWTLLREIIAEGVVVEQHFLAPPEAVQAFAASLRSTPT